MLGPPNILFPQTNGRNLDIMLDEEMVNKLLLIDMYVQEPITDSEKEHSEIWKIG